MATEKQIQEAVEQLKNGFSDPRFQAAATKIMQDFDDEIAKQQTKHNDKNWGGKRDGAGRPHQTITIRVGQRLLVQKDDGHTVQGKVTKITSDSFTVETEEYYDLTIYDFEEA